MYGVKTCCRCKRELPADGFHFYIVQNTKDNLRSSCKECNGSKFSKPKILVMHGYKLCSRCNRELPADKFHFFANVNTCDALHSACKECEGKKFSISNDIETHRVCIKCGGEFPATKEYFSVHKGRKNNIEGTCKKCRNLQSAQYREENKEKWDEYDRQYYKDNRDVIIQRSSDYYKDNRETVLVKVKQYGISNKEAIRAKDIVRSRKYRANNKGKLAKTQKIWLATHKGIRNIWKQKRKAKERLLISTFSSKDLEDCLNFFNHKDTYTGLPMNSVSQDHVIPVSKGGHYVRQNIVICEKSVNSSKHKSDMETWYRRQPFFSEERLSKIHEWIGLKNGIQQLSLI